MREVPKQRVAPRGHSRSASAGGKAGDQLVCYKETGICANRRLVPSSRADELRRCTVSLAVLFGMPRVCDSRMQSKQSAGYVLSCVLLI